MSAQQEGDAARGAGRKRRQGGATHNSTPISAADELWKRLKSSSAAPAAGGKGASLLAAITAPPAPRIGVAEGAAAVNPSSRPAWMAALGALAPLKAAAAPAAAPRVAAQAAPGLRTAAAAVLHTTDALTGGAVGPAVVVAETRRFAGEDIVVQRAYEPGSRAAREAVARAASARTGLDAMLQSVEARKGMTALEKTRIDWAGAKAAAPEVAEDLARHVRSSDAWRGQQDFLKRAAESEYDREREARAAADARARGSRR